MDSNPPWESGKTLTIFKRRRIEAPCSLMKRRRGPYYEPPTGLDPNGISSPGEASLLRSRLFPAEPYRPERCHGCRNWDWLMITHSPPLVSRIFRHCSRFRVHPSSRTLPESSKRGGLRRRRHECELWWGKEEQETDYLQQHIGQLHIISQ